MHPALIGDKDLDNDWVRTEFADHGAIAARYNKTARGFAAMINLTAAVMALK